MNFLGNKLSMLILTGATLLQLTGCTTSKVDLFVRKDVDTSKSRIIVFPMLLWDGKALSAANSSYSNPMVDAALTKDWAAELGADSTVSIPKIALDKIPGSYQAMSAFIKSLDGVSAVEQSSKLTSFLQAISKQFGDGAFALALVTDDEAGFKAKKSLQVNMGLFDTKTLTWKWIAKTEEKASLVPVPYPAFVQNLVSANYDYLKKENSNQVR
jgi:hypothetical protein